jgi:glyoxylase-like metal-dependent hydrolase (beta-lactamase superfamily II)
MMSGTIKFQIEFEMDPTGKIVGIEKIGGGDTGKPPEAPTPPHSDIIVMAATKHSPGHICFWINGQWVCF